jgi:hypothetical protein
MVEKIEADETRREAEKEKLAAEAFERIRTGQHWRDWMFIADGLMVGRFRAMRRAATDNIQDPKYRRAFREWMNERQWARDLDNPTRSHLFWCADHRSELEAWRDTLASNKRAELNHPSTMKRAYERAHADKAAKAAPQPETRYQRLEREFEQVSGELADARERLAATDQGSLFDLHKDTAAEIAEVIIKHLKLARTRGIRDALTKVIKREEETIRKQPKPAG